MEKCQECGGGGKVECIHCYGTGKHGSDPNKPCPECKGQKTQRCWNCGGSGKV